MKPLTDYFPILNQAVNGNRLVYLDNASTSQKPQSVLDALHNFYATCNANIYRGVHAFGEKATQMYEDVRVKVQICINAQDVSEIVFTRGATESINFVADAWAQNHIKKGDSIVLTELEHHANLVPWQRVSHKTGAKLRFIPVRQDGNIDYSQLDTLIDNSTKLVAITHVSNALGTHVDVVKIAKRAQEVGAKVLIDAAQTVPHQKVDVQQLKCDFLVFSGHKMLAPTGVGVLYINKRLHDDVEPYQLGGGMVHNVSYLKSTWVKAPHKFEAGTPPIAQVIGLGAAIDWMQEHINFDELQKHEANLCAKLIEGLQKLPNIRILGPIEQLKQWGHLVSFVVDNMHAHDVAAYLDQHGIAVRAGHHCAQPLAEKLNYIASVRASFYVYNSLQDVAALLDVLRKIS